MTIIELMTTQNNENARKKEIFSLIIYVNNHLIMDCQGVQYKWKIIAWSIFNKD